MGRLLDRSIARTKLPGRPDFVYPHERLAVFVHGCFWHRCSIHSKAPPKTHTAFWARKFARNVERDRLNREELESMGWKVVEVWEHEVREKPRACARRVLAEVRARKREQAID